MTNPLRRLLCLFGIHKRSRGGIREANDIILSNCRYCHAPMCKFDGKWRVRH
jgi:hypothetical protein